MLSRMQTSVRVSIRNRDGLARIAAEDYGGVSLDEALARLLDEHWERQAVAAVEATQQADPDGFAAYVRTADEDGQRDGAPVDEPWEGPVPKGPDPVDWIWPHHRMEAFVTSVDRLVEAAHAVQELGRRIAPQSAEGRQAAEHPANRS
jgi:hypothetical protein